MQLYCWFLLKWELHMSTMLLYLYNLHQLKYPLPLLLNYHKKLDK